MTLVERLLRIGICFAFSFWNINRAWTRLWLQCSPRLLLEAQLLQTALGAAGPRILDTACKDYQLA